MGRWVRVAATGELPPGRGRTVVVGDLRLALFHEAGEFFVLDDTCPHRGASLGEGLLLDGKVICPWHSWIFELRTGRNPRAPQIAIGCYPTRVVEGSIEVEVPE